MTDREDKGQPASSSSPSPRSPSSRGDAGDRQIEGAKVGMTHVIGLGSACAVHILEKAAV